MAKYQATIKYTTELTIEFEQDEYPSDADVLEHAGDADTHRHEDITNERVLELSEAMGH